MTGTRRSGVTAPEDAGGPLEGREGEPAAGGASTAGVPESGGGGDMRAARDRTLTLAFAALGVVYGDIGTSPLYALRESFHHAVGPTPANVLGVLSLIFWSLIVVISVKYLIFVLRADNNGEGGILALTTLVAPPDARRRSRLWFLLVLGLFGTALLYGDGMITPAISVLSAVEGIDTATSVFQPYILPVTILILVALFWFQRRGTAGVGRWFGPVTLVWFGALAALGVNQIVRAPTVLWALDPLKALDFFLRNGGQGFLVLGSVFLVVTGGEALYADLGHFGRRPIRLVWFTVVLPGLLLNYFGQGALVLRHPEAVKDPFYLMAPGWALYPVVLIATAATIIASQAIISGAFSLAMQSVQLGYLPRLDIRHTSPTEIGQIYVGAINWLLMVACVALVLGFRSSSNLASAYGVAVTMTMVITTLLLFTVARWRWSWPAWKAYLLAAGFPRPRSRVRGREPVQGGGWRLVPAAGGGRRFHADDDVAAGAADRSRQLALRGETGDRSDARAGCGGLRQGARHRHLHDGGPGDDAAGVHPQPAPQSGASRAGGVPVGAVRRRAAHRRERP